MKRPALSPRSSEFRRLALGTIVAALVVVAAIVSGSVDQWNATLQLMGFDPDRAQLIAALLIGAVAAAVSALASGRIGDPTLLGVLCSSVLYGGTFVAETQSALRSAGAASSFDPGGWLITLLTLLVSGVVSGWAGATVAMVVRPAVADTIRMLGWIVGWLLMLAPRAPLPRLARAKVAIWAQLAISGASDGRPDRRPAPLDRRVAFRASIVALVTGVLFVTVPVFGDLVSYSPDVRMLQGGRRPADLGGPASTPTPPPATTPGRSTGGAPSTSPSGSPSPSIDPKPWLGWHPSAKGQVVAYHLPAPWTGGLETQLEVSVYTPAGYQSNGSLKYPTLYEVPWNFATWERAADLTVALDALIDSGAIPPAIVVFVDAGRGPYPDSECANSYDGREWYDRFVAETVVPWVDSHYRTIAQPGARAIMGMSQGGYCAAILALHHPDVFGTSISFSGYFHAGVAGSNSARPFGGNQQALNAASPDIVIGQLAPPIRTSLYFIVIAQPSQALYGPQAAEFDGLLTADGYPHLAIAATQQHGWSQVREELAPALQAWAARLAATGVF
jgi:S-formylglutathione hydrolase FrmB